MSWQDHIDALVDVRPFDPENPDDPLGTARAEQMNAAYEALRELKGPLSGAIDEILSHTAAHPGGGPGAGDNAPVLHVTLEGNSNRTGLSWGEALRTHAAAFAAMPTQQGEYDSVVNTWPKGALRSGPGTFVEDQLPLPAAAWVHWQGVGGGYQGTVIAAGDGTNEWLVAPPPTFTTEFAHFLVFRGLVFDGRRQENPLGPGLVKLINGGFGCAFVDCYFRNTEGVGLQIEGNAANVLLHNTTFVSCKGAALRWLVSGDNGTVVLSGTTQLDNCGPAAIDIVQTDDAGPYNALVIDTLKAEAVLGEAVSTDHHQLIKITPRPNQVGDRFYLNATYIKASRNINPHAVGSAVIYEEAGGQGTGARIKVGRLWAPEYEVGVDSAKQSVTIPNQADDVVVQGGWGKDASSVGFDGGLKPSRWVDGVPHWDAAHGAPGAVDAPNGATWTDVTGNGQLYVRLGGEWRVIDTSAA